MNGRFKALRVLTPLRPGLPDHLFVSRNSKTGWSINVSIAMTCSPTRACMEYCYGTEGRIKMDAALRKQAENARFFAEATPREIDREAVDVTHVVGRTQSFLRMFGVGDLQEGSVRFVNAMCRYALGAKPEFRVWVSTRRPELAERLVDSSNLSVMLSHDGTTPAPKRAAMAALMRRPSFFGAWVSRGPDDVAPPEMRVTFLEHHVGVHGRAGWPALDPRICPVTIRGGAEHEGACARCMFCIEPTRRKGGVPGVEARRAR